MSKLGENAYRLYNKGLTWREVAMHLNSTENSVYKAARRHAEAANRRLIRPSRPEPLAPVEQMRRAHTKGVSLATIEKFYRGKNLAEFKSQLMAKTPVVKRRKVAQTQEELPPEPTAPRRAIISTNFGEMAKRLHQSRRDLVDASLPTWESLTAEQRAFETAAVALASRLAGAQ